MKTKALWVQILLIAHCASPPEIGPRAGLCLDNETAVFSCSVEGGKVLSLCESGELDHATGTLKYRYGRPNHVELEFPTESDQGTAPFFQGHRPWSRVAGNEEFTVEFTIGEWNYAVFEILDVTNGYEDRYGVRVMQTGGIPVAIECRGVPDVNQLEELRNKIPEG